MKLTILTLATAVICLAQSPAFEVASIKVNNSGSGMSAFPSIRNGTLKAENTTFRSILQTAYGLTSLQITGPGWIDSDRYDVTAKAPQGVPDSEVEPMLQAMLKERFHLVAHSETKDLPVYDLIVGKSGLKIFRADDADHPLKMPPRVGASSMLIGSFIMDQFAKALTSASGRPVLNKTGLEGKYSIALQYLPLSTQGAQANTSDSGTDIFAALEQQTGLKLEPKKESIPTLVVDSADRVPTEN